MSPRIKHQLKIASAWGGIAAISILAGRVSYLAHEDVVVEQMRDFVEHAAAAFDPEDVRHLSGLREDVRLAEYVVLRAALRRLKDVDQHTRRARLIRIVPDVAGTVLLADSDELEGVEASLPGEILVPMVEPEDWRDLQRVGQPATGHPRETESGRWITAYAPVRAAKSDVVRDVLALDFDSDPLSSGLWKAGLEGMVLVWIGLGLPLAAWLIGRRYREQGEVLRNLSEAVEQSHSEIVILDRKGRVEYANRALYENTGYSRREMVGRPWWETLEEVGTEVVVRIQEGLAWEGEWEARRKERGAYPVRGSLAPVRRQDGSLACFVVVGDDISEARRREQELREASELAQAGDRAKSQFLATMSHEVRTPLNGIVGFSSLLMETSLTAEQREYVQTIRMSSDALIQLTGDILDFAHIEAGRLKLEPVPVDPRECVESSLDMLAARAAEKRIELLHRVEDDVPACVMVDAGRLRQVLVNLIGNAVKFTEQGEVEVQVTKGRTDPGPGDAECTLIFSVRDTGMGIPASQHERIFRAFTQVDETISRRHGGTGLGLAISRNLVGQMGGQISVASTPGKGSTFTFSIRVSVSMPPPAPFELNGLRLGLVMSSGSLRREMAALVRAWRGVAIEVAAVTDLSPEACDLMLVDVDETLAGEIARRAEPMAGWHPEKSIALMPVTLGDDARQGLRRHFRAVIHKPVHHQNLHAMLMGMQKGLVRPAAPREKFQLRVLVAEDNPVNQRLIRRMLDHFGCQITLAEDGRKALDALCATPGGFDLMLLDLHMPEMDGFEVLAAIRGGKAGPLCQDLAIYALTADAREQQRTRGMQAGLNGYLTKPVGLPDLEAVLRAFCEERDRPAGSA